MDRNTIMGFVLIALILIGFNFFTHTTDDKSQKEKERTTIDSAHTAAPQTTATTTSATDTGAAKNADTIPAGVPATWASFARGTNQEVILQNEDVIVHISTKGGRVSYAELKKYKTFDQKPLVMIKPESSSFNYRLTTAAADESINTSDLYFTPQNQTASSVTMAVTLPGGQSIQQIYSLDKEGYLIHDDLKLVKMNEVIPRKDSYFNLTWKVDAQKHEKDSSIAAQNATVHYRMSDEKPTYLSETADDKKEFKGNTDWVSFKQQFFCQTLITSGQPFIGADLVTQLSSQPGVLKHYEAELNIPFDHKPEQVFKMHFYMGPLKYKTLKSIGEVVGAKESLELERQIPLGWSFFLISMVNRYIIIPVFNVLSAIGNYGIIILILAIFIKILVLPFTYKTYLSTAKMRLIKPEIDEIKAKSDGDMAKQQQETMKLYRKAGVSPFGGCLPLLLQFPILVAMFRFFPSSIELRQEHFLWATDLSTYDSIWDFGYVPIIHSIYGDHVSLFTLLMTISTLIYTRMNNSLSPQQSEFKWMSYLMPIMFLGFFNKYSAGLSLYYFYFNILTFGQQYLFKLFINEDKLKAKIEANKKKPAKKSGLQARLEDMSKRQQELARQRATNGTPKKPTRRK